MRGARRCSDQDLGSSIRGWRIEPPWWRSECPGAATGGDLLSPRLDPGGWDVEPEIFEFQALRSSDLGSRALRDARGQGLGPSMRGWRIEPL
eukprot:1547050-Pyramimonas_sp.AAC.1